MRLHYFRPMVLVTGGTGLVGSHLLYALLAQGERVRASKRTTSNISDVGIAFKLYTHKPEKLLSQIEWVDVDLSNPAEVDDLFEGVESVFHCAAHVSFRAKDGRLMRTLNPLITATLVNAALAHGVKHFAHVSSVAAIGRTKNQQEAITESTTWKNTPTTSNYAISKYLSELEVWRGIEEGLPAAMVNPALIMGLGNWNQSSNTFFKTLSKPFKFYTNGQNGFVDVRDVVAALLALREKHVVGERFILVGQNLKYREVFSALAKGFGHEPPNKEAKEWVLGIIWRFEKMRSILFGTKPVLTRETAHTTNSNWFYSNQKAKDVLGIEFRNVMESFKELVPLYKEHYSPSA